MTMRTATQREAFRVQRELIPIKEPVILDIGAHVGNIAVRYRGWFPLCKLYCFEPFPQSFQALSHNTAADPLTFCYQSAMSDNNGSAVLNSNVSAPTNSLLKTDEGSTSYWGEGLLDTISQVEVSTTTVDTFCLETGISHIDIMKMDVQGAEFSVLAGAKDSLANKRISLIYTEVIMCPTYKGQHKLHEYLSFMDSYGYDFLDFFNPVRTNDQLIQADAVFVASSLER